MKINAKDLRKVFIEWEPEDPPPPPGPDDPPPPPPPPPGDDNPWDEEPPEGKRGKGGGEGGPVGPIGPGGVGQGNGEIADAPANPIITQNKAADVTDLGKEWEKSTKEEMKRSASSIPGGLKVLLDDMFSKPLVNWKRLLKRYVTKMSSRTDYFLPHKRLLGSGDVMWGSKKSFKGFESMIVICDTSGSISDDELNQFVSETFDIMKSFKPKETYLIWCDATVYTPVDVLKGTKDKWKLNKADGRGGTDFRPPFAWIQENILGKKKIGPVIFFTDGYPTGNGGWPELGQYGIDKYKSNVFWVIVSTKRPNEDIKVPFGTKIDLVR